MTEALRIRLVAARPETLAEFYCTALGFSRSGNLVAHDPFCGTPVSGCCLRLGDQFVEIVRFERSTPSSTQLIASNDPHFQHFAIAVPDMPRAMQHLSTRTGWTAISAGGARQLPRSSGGAIAFKFRDPEGHPLELLQFPKGNMSEVWCNKIQLFMGIDHTAIVVGNLQASISFLEEEGFEKTAASLNKGAEQAALDGVTAPVVDVVALSRGVQPPHLELLHYRQPAAGVAPRLADDCVLATRTILRREGEGVIGPDGHRFIT
ncbi:VOC family protein [Pseudorhodobacter sp.]|uniref:VOC family protein n=1 Tax=Pseudorhodobacter sp. TaxID=1934400 RepID=UPI002648F338|nr:VOC family protein [Pseudorhodobacter sp.]MDN5787248.1 VOC family protein [Pseudorhodobacter sp.]